VLSLAICRSPFTTASRLPVHLVSTPIKFQAPKSFPFFPQPVNIQHAEMPATSFASWTYFILPVTTGVGSDLSQIAAQVTKCNAFLARMEQSRIQSARRKAGL
jgi:hypothetical protein